ncbi:MAG TPA: FecR domain-containing protein [Stellaceae bacterium]|nr:FecR domain-containing protein [Stellaceae bacterium]
MVAVRGQCFAVSGGQRRLLTLGAVVNVGDIVQVPAPARLKLRMNDGSIVSVASGSEMTIRDYAVDASGQRRNALLSLGLGLLRALVTTSSSAQFEVETAVGVAAVRSTDWFISVVPGSEQVGVLRGAVTLTSRATGRSVTIPARWGGRLEAGRDPVPPRLWSPAEFDDVIARTNVE